MWGLNYLKESISFNQTVKIKVVW